MVDSGFLDMTWASGRLGSWGALGAVIFSALGCSSADVLTAKVGDNGPAVRDGSSVRAGDARTDSNVTPDSRRPTTDAAPSSDAGVFVPVDAGPARPLQKLCTDSEGGAGATTDAHDPSCTWARCPGAAALSIGPENCVRMSDTAVRCTSGAGPELVDEGLSGVQALVSGALHHCALLSDGTVWCWGDNKWGALGDPSLPAETVRAAPAKVAGLENIVRIDTRDSFQQQDTTCALDRGGEVTCWGGDWPRALTPVPALAGSREIAVADFSVCGLRDSGTIKCVYTDGAVTTYLLNDRVLDLTAAFYMLCARTEHLDVFCMGAGGKPAPSLKPELSGARFLSAGLGQVCGLLADGTVGCTVGSEGSTFQDRCEGSDVVDLDATQRFLCALHADGTISCRSSD